MRLALEYNGGECAMVDDRKLKGGCVRRNTMDQRPGARSATFDEMVQGSDNSVEFVRER